MTVSEVFVGFSAIAEKGGSPFTKNFPGKWHSVFLPLVIGVTKHFFQIFYLKFGVQNHTLTRAELGPPANLRWLGGGEYRPPPYLTFEPRGRARSVRRRSKALNEGILRQS